MKAYASVADHARAMVEENTLDNFLGAVHNLQLQCGHKIPAIELKAGMSFSWFPRFAREYCIEKDYITLDEQHNECITQRGIDFYLLSRL